MTDKEHERFLQVITVFVGLILGFAIGGLVVSERYGSEIRTDQVELKEDVAEIKEDKAIIDDLVRELLSQIEHIKAERKNLDELKILLSKGEPNVKK